MKQLKADPQTESIPIIAITASAMTNNRTAMLAEGFDGYQTKPITLKDFLGEVERVLEVRSSESVVRSWVFGRRLSRAKSQRTPRYD